MIGRGLEPVLNDAFRKSMEARLLLSAGSAPTDFAGTDEYRKQIRYSCLAASVRFRAPAFNRTRART